MKRVLAALTTGMTGLALIALIVIVPLALATEVGWPLVDEITRSRLSVDTIRTAIGQRNVSSTVVIDSLAIVVWIVWIQLVWALGWEALVNGPRLVGGRRATPPPFVFGPVSRIASKLVAGMFAASVALSASGATNLLPARPALALTPFVSDPVGSSPVSGHGGGSPDGGGQARTSADSEWIVASGDSLWAIAERVFGDGGRSGEILALNPHVRGPSDVVVGVRLRLPAGASTVTTTEEPPARALAEVELEIEPGDNLWNLSAARIERSRGCPPPMAAVAAYVEQVVDHNRADIESPDLIHPGQVFTLPAIGSEAGPDDERGSDAGPGTDSGTKPGSEASPTIDQRPALDGADVGPAPDPEASDTSAEVERDRRGEPEAAVDTEPDPDVVDEDGSGPGLTMFGGGGSLLAAGALGMILRRRRFQRAHRREGEEPAAPPDEVGATLAQLRREADVGALNWLTAALGSLAVRPIWEGEPVAQPVFARLDSDHLEVVFSAADPMGGPLPWREIDGGTRWRLDRETPIADLPDPGTCRPLPALVSIGNGLLLNLEAAGVLTIDGPNDSACDLVRSLVHELMTGPAGPTIDIRTTIPIGGTASYELVTRLAPSDLLVELTPWIAAGRQRLGDRSASNAYCLRLLDADAAIDPVVIVTDPEGARDLGPLVDAAAERTYPLALVIVGGAPEPGEASIALDDRRAVLEPWGLEFDPQLLTDVAARGLGSALADARRSGDRSPSAAAVSSPVLVPEPTPPQRPERLEAEEEQQPESDAAPPNDLDSDSDQDSGLEPEPDVDREAEVVRDERLPAESEKIWADQVVISVLGPVAVTGAPADLSTQQLSLVTFLAVNPSARREAIIEALWDGQPISKSRFPNVLAETRAKIGRHRFPEASDGRYRLDGVTTDLARFESLVQRAKRAEGDDRIGSLRKALALVTGEPFTTPGGRFWSWVSEHHHVAARTAALVADTALRLTRLEQEAGDLEAARWACEQGLLASPADEPLVLALTEVYLGLGKPALAQRIVDGWEEQINALDCGEPSDEPRRRLAG